MPPRLRVATAIPQITQALANTYHDDPLIRYNVQRMVSHNDHNAVDFTIEDVEQYFWQLFFDTLQALRSQGSDMIMTVLEMDDYQGIAVYFSNVSNGNCPMANMLHEADLDSVNENRRRGQPYHQIVLAGSLSWEHQDLAGAVVGHIINEQVPGTQTPIWIEVSTDTMFQAFMRKAFSQEAKFNFAKNFVHPNGSIYDPGRRWGIQMWSLERRSPWAGWNADNPQMVRSGTAPGGDYHQGSGPIFSGYSGAGGAGYASGASGAYGAGGGGSMGQSFQAAAASAERKRKDARRLMHEYLVDLRERLRKEAERQRIEKQRREEAERRQRERDRARDAQERRREERRPRQEEIESINRAARRLEIGDDRSHGSSGRPSSRATSRSPSRGHYVDYADPRSHSSKSNSSSKGKGKHSSAAGYFPS